MIQWDSQSYFSFFHFAVRDGIQTVQDMDRIISDQDIRTDIVNEKKILDCQEL